MTVFPRLNPIHHIQRSDSRSHFVKRFHSKSCKLQNVPQLKRTAQIKYTQPCQSEIFKRAHIIMIDATDLSENDYTHQLVYMQSFLRDTANSSRETVALKDEVREEKNNN